MPANGKRPVYRFSHFEVDAQDQELRKHSVRIKLQEQPFRLLEALLQQPGTLVTREELHARLWPDDTFVDFDHGLNAAAARLRQALGDSARLPRFVESVPRRGYRFIAPVEIVAPMESKGQPKPVAETPRPQRSNLKLTVLVASFVVAIAASIWWLQPREHPRAVLPFKFTLTPPDGTNFVELDPVVLSPNGRYMVFPAADNSGETELWIRPLDEVSARRIEGTRGAAFPFWSPDSRSVGFFANEKLYRVETAGGLPKIVCSAADGRGGTWSADNLIVFAPSLKSPLYQVPAAGGEPKALTSLNAARQEISHRWPSFLPDGRHFLFVIRTAQPKQSGIYLGSLRDGLSELLIPTLSNVVYADDMSGGGYLLYAHDATLVARPFNARALKFIGPEFPVADVYNRALLEPLRADFSVSNTGVLVYRTRRAADRLTWFDRTGARLHTLGETGVHLGISLSPSEKEVAFTRRDPHTGRQDIWRADRVSAATTRVTFGPADQFDPVWSPDGSRLLYASTNVGYSSLHTDTTCEIREIGLDGHGDRLLLTAENLTAPWSTDGRFLLYHEIQNGRKMDTWALPLAGRRKPIPLLQGSPNQVFPVFSSDGKWIAYSSDESGKWEVYVAPFSPERAPAGKRMVSDGGGSHAEWSRDGKQLYYLAADKRIMAVAVDTAHERFTAGAPRALFQSDIVNDFRARFAVTSDGQQFLIPSTAGQGGPAVATVMVNWMPAR
jgi:eukaryotic-like serine/threonine-protein kinase